MRNLVTVLREYPFQMFLLTSEENLLQIIKPELSEWEILKNFFLSIFLFFPL